VYGIGEEEEEEEEDEEEGGRRVFCYVALSYL